MINKPCGIDLYQGDTVLGDSDEGFAQVRAAGIIFLDHKASQGIDETDSRCALRRAKWMSGIAIHVVDVDGTSLSLQPRFGFYHFNGGGPAVTEAKWFISRVKLAGYQTGDDLCLDWEDIGASGQQMSAVWADNVCDTVEQWCGFPIKIYGGDAPREQLAKSLPSALLDRFALRRDWHCQYGLFDPADVPLPWHANGPDYWQDDGDQYGPGPHYIAGVTGYCDNSTVVGSMTIQRLYSRWAGGGVEA